MSNGKEFHIRGPLCLRLVGSFRSPNREKMKICASTSVVWVDRRIEYKIIRKTQSKTKSQSYWANRRTTGTFASPQRNRDNTDTVYRRRLYKQNNEKQSRHYVRSRYTHCAHGGKTETNMV